MCRLSSNIAEKLLGANIQVRQYKKDLEDVRKKLMKAEDEFAFQKNKEALMGAQLQVNISGCRNKSILRKINDKN